MRTINVYNIQNVYNTTSNVIAQSRKLFSESVYFVKAKYNASLYSAPFLNRCSYLLVSYFLVPIILDFIISFEFYPGYYYHFITDSDTLVLDHESTLFLRWSDRKKHLILELFCFCFITIYINSNNERYTMYRL